MWALGVEPQIIQGLVDRSKELAFSLQSDGKPLKAFKRRELHGLFFGFLKVTLASMWPVNFRGRKSGSQDGG